ncbi:cation transporter, partial [Micrococcus luteus]|nr:cation transporter [Micrococcus luteus]
MTRRDTRETGPSGRRSGATELPPEIERVVQQAKRLEWATLGVIVVT